MSAQNVYFRAMFDIYSRPHCVCFYDVTMAFFPHKCISQHFSKSSMIIYFQKCFATRLKKDVTHCDGWFLYFALYCLVCLLSHTGRGGYLRQSFLSDLDFKNQQLRKICWSIFVMGCKNR